MTRLQFIQMNQVNTELYLSKRPISAKNYELGLISSDYRLKKLVRQSLRNLTRTLSNSLGEIVIVQENYVRIKNLVKLLIKFDRQKTIDYGMQKTCDNEIENLTWKHDY